MSSLVALEMPTVLEKTWPLLAPLSGWIYRKLSTALSGVMKQTTPHFLTRDTLSPKHTLPYVITH